MTARLPLKVLFVTNMFPTESRPSFGIFVDEQIKSVTAALDCEWDLHFINAREKGTRQYLRSIFTLPFKVARGEYDVIHVHYGLAGLFLLFFKPRARTFLTLHGADILQRQGRVTQIRLTKAVIERVDHVFILSEEMEEVIRPLTSRYSFLPCGVDTSLFHPGPGPDPERSHRTVVFPGHPLNPVKDFGLFEEAIHLLRERTDMRIETACIVQLSRSGVRDLLDGADCLLMTSLSEGSPQVVKEALACGLPVVSVPVGDVATVTAGVPGCHVSNARDAGELADLVLENLTSDVDRGSVREAFLEKRTYDQASVTARLLEHYLGEPDRSQSSPPNAPEG